MSKMVNCKACGKEIAKGVKKCVHCGKDQRNFFMRHKLITGILVIAILVGIGNAMGNGDDKASTGTSTSSLNTSKQEPKVEVTISAKDLAKFYEDNEVKADKDYKGKLAKITGKVEDIGVALGNTYVVLSAEEDFALTSVQCYFDDKAEIDKVSNLKKGDEVTIEGVIEGKSLNVGVNKCKLK